MTRCSFGSMLLSVLQSALGACTTRPNELQRMDDGLNDWKALPTRWSVLSRRFHPSKYLKLSILIDDRSPPTNFTTTHSTTTPYESQHLSNAVATVRRRIRNSISTLA